MTLPNIPDINPIMNLKREEVIHLLLSSIALEEIGLSHILNAEGEKIQQVISKRPSLDDLLSLNYSLERTLRNTIKSQMLLHYKLEDLIDLVRMGKLHSDEEWHPDEEKLLADEEETAVRTKRKPQAEATEDDGFEDDGFEEDEFEEDANEEDPFQEDGLEDDAFEDPSDPLEEEDEQQNESEGYDVYIDDDRKD